MTTARPRATAYRSIKVREARSSRRRYSPAAAEHGRRPISVHAGHADLRRGRLREDDGHGRAQAEGFGEEVGGAGQPSGRPVSDGPSCPPKPPNSPNSSTAIFFEPDVGPQVDRRLDHRWASPDPGRARRRGRAAKPELGDPGRSPSPSAVPTGAPISPRTGDTPLRRPRASRTDRRLPVSEQGVPGEVLAAEAVGDVVPRHLSRQSCEKVYSGLPSR